MTFRPHPTRSGFIFLGGAILFGIAAIFFMNRLLQSNELPNIFILLASLLLALTLMGLALYGVFIAFRLDYHLNRNGLAIRWGLCRQIIPMASVMDLVPGWSLSPLAFTGIDLAGLRLGWGELVEYGSIQFYTTAPLADSLLVVTPYQGYLISPDQPDRFIEAWHARQALGPTQHWSFEIQRNWPLNVPVIADRLTWGLLGLATLACLTLFGYIALKFPDLPPSLPIHFNTLGNADRIADKSTLLILPAAGAIGLIVNGLLGSLIYRAEKVGAYMLWGSAIVLQIVLWIAAMTVTAPGR
jgi:hypothetical protein